MGIQKVVYPGTFDPMTLGHSDILARAATMFDQVILAISASSNKKTLFTLEERINMATREIAGISNVTVMCFEGLLVKFVKQVDSKIVIRGLRAVSDFEYEFQMSYMNNKLNNGVETIFLPATENSHFISSSFVKEIARLDGKLDGLVSTDVAKVLRGKFNA